MKVQIWKDERWPDYGITEGEAMGPDIEIPDELYKRYEKANKEYSLVQKELEELYNKSNYPKAESA